MPFYKTKLRKSIRHLTSLAGDRGASMVEYALLVALIAMIAVAALTFAGGEVSSSYSDIAASFEAYS